MDAPTFSVLSEVFPAEILAMVDDHLVELYRKENGAKCAAVVRAELRVDDDCKLFGRIALLYQENPYFGLEARKFYDSGLMRWSRYIYSMQTLETFMHDPTLVGRYVVRDKFYTFEIDFKDMEFSTDILVYHYHADLNILRRFLTERNKMHLYPKLLKTIKSYRYIGAFLKEN
nr:hypothetical protein K-LCC10_0291 [Kaumoebavirus]